MHLGDQWTMSSFKWWNMHGNFAFIATMFGNMDVTSGEQFFCRGVGALTVSSTMLE
jgi:hypothetical protein